MSPTLVPAYVGVGCNIGDCKQRFRDVRTALGALPACHYLCASRVYRTAPHGVTDQADFLNAVVALLTTLSAEALLQALLSLEQRAGRQRDNERRWGPRTLDLDLLVYGRSQLSQPALTVPHPRIGERNFVLLPLLDVAPGLTVPGLGSVRSLAQSVSHAGVHCIEDFRW